MKYTPMHVGIATTGMVALLSIATNASAAFSPEFYEERRLAREQAAMQVQADQFDRFHNGAMNDGMVWREIGKRTTGDVTAKGKGAIQDPIIRYVIEERVIMEPLTDTGPALHTALVLALGMAGGLWYKRRTSLV